jgi:RND family efflux transporter MFP subunit
MKFIFLMFSISTALFATSCRKESTTVTPDTFQVMQPIVQNITYQNEYIAEIQSVRYVEVRSRVKGYVEQLHVDEGQIVQEGQLLFTISSKTYSYELQKAQAAVKNAIADLQSAQLELTNTRSLVEKNIVSKAELKMIEAKVDALKASVEEAEAHKEQSALNVSFSKIRAPYKGIINRLTHKLGSLIDEGSMLTSISDNREIFAYFNLSETDYLNYLASNKEEARHVNLVLANQTRYQHTGNIEIIESEFDRSTGNIAFRARFPNPDRILKHGANGKIIVTEQFANAMLIPQKSTFEIQDKLYAFVMKKDSVIEQRNIVTKMRLPHYYVVESGLKQDETIIYEGVQNAKDGNKILPKRVEANTIVSALGAN